MQDTQPKRIQRQRMKDWRMPPNTVYVGRPTVWGNPYSTAFWRGYFDDELALVLYRNSASNGWRPKAVPESVPDAIRVMVYEYHCAFIGRFRANGYHGAMLDIVRAELRGKNLACWCPLDQPCHADVLLELANRDLKG